MTNIKMEKAPLENVIQVEESINIITQLDSPLEMCVTASENLKEELPQIHSEDPKLFLESCESILEILLDSEIKNEEVKENIFCALGDSMNPAVKQDYPEMWETSLQFFESAYERGYKKNRASQYIGCMLFGQDPIELENSIAKTKRFKSTIKRIKRLEKNDSSDKKILSEKLHRYINPELLDESEVVFEFAFVALCNRLGYEYRQLKEIYKSKTPVNECSAIEGREIADGIVILLDVLKNCMNEDLQKKKPDLFNKGVERLRRMSSYQMGMFSEGPGSRVSLPYEFERVVHKSINVGLNVTLSTQKAREAFSSENR